MKYDSACLVNSPFVIIIFRSIGHDHKNVIENDYRSDSASQLSRENYCRQKIHFLKLNVVNNIRINVHCTRVFACDRYCNTRL